MMIVFKRRSVALLVGLFGMVAGPLAAAAQGGLTAPQMREEELFRQHQAELLRGPGSALGMVALNKIAPGDTTVGSAPDDGIQMAGLSPHLLTLHAEGDVLSLRPTLPLREAFKADGKPVQAGIVRFDADGTSPKYTQGTANFVLRHKFGFFLVGRDTAAPALVGFHGLSWYLPQARYRVLAKWIPYPAPRPLSIANVLGQVEDMPSYGVVEFSLGGKPYRLEPVVHVEREKPLFFIFRDLTSRTETYQGGRFLDAGMPDHGLSQPGTVVLDFNQARNPLCAFSEHTSCPLPPEQNRLPVSIAAGERRYHP